MATMTTASASPTEKREALDEVLRSETFVRADQLRSFLRYVCEMEIAGRGEELCESLIGVNALGRPADYSPTEDASVRRRAIDLREKLQHVYDTELAGSNIRIELPKGKYVPRFVRVAPEIGIAIPATAVPVEHAPAGHAAIAQSNDQRIETALQARLDAAVTRPRRRSAVWFVAGWATGVLMVAMGSFLLRWLQSSAPPLSPSSTAAVSASPASVRPVPFEPGTTYEAEATSNTFHGRTYSQLCGGCSGGGRVRHIGNGPDNYVVLNNIIVAKTGNYEMVIVYFLEGSRSFLIKVNDDPPAEIPVSGKSWQDAAKTSITVSLKAGSNKVKFYHDAGYAPDLDRIVIR